MSEMPPDLEDGDIEEFMVLGCCLPWVPEIVDDVRDAND